MKDEVAGQTPSAFDPTAMPGGADFATMFGPYFAAILIIGLVICVFSIFCWWKIFSKAGYSGALSLVFLAGLIPLVGPIICLVLFIWFSFAEWPVVKKAQGVA